MRLAIVSQRVIVDKQGAPHASAEEGAFLNQVAQWSGGITVYTPLGADERRAVLRLSAQVAVRPLPDRLRVARPGPSGALAAARDWLDQMRIFMAGFPRHQAVYIFQPSSYGCLAALAARLRRIPYGVSLGGSIEGLKGGSRWRRFPLAHRAFGLAFSLGMLLTMRGARFILLSGPLPFRRLLPSRLPVFTEAPRILLTPADMHERTDTCQSRPIRLLSVGRLTREKGVPDLIAALAMLRNTGVDARLSVVGGGLALGGLQSQVLGLGLGDAVTFAGPIANGPELFAYYRQSDIFVMPSWREGLPRVLYEAAGHSLPMVSTDVGDIAHRLQPGVDLLLVPPQSPEHLARAIRRVVEDADLRRRLIQSGFAAARKAIEVNPAKQFADIAARYFLGPPKP